MARANSAGGETDAERFAPRPVSTKSAAAQIADQIRAGVAGGKLVAGERLPAEHELATQFGVSRATVREAIKILAASQLVQSTRGAGGGTFIVLPDPDFAASTLGEMIWLWFQSGDISLAEVDGARAWVERGCVRLAAENRTDADLAVIKRFVDDARDPAISMDEWLALDIEFHVAISRAAKNRVLELAMTAIHLARPRTNTLLMAVLDREPVVRQHHAIWEAIRDGDPDAAERAFIAHSAHLAAVQEEALASRDAKEISIAALSEEMHPPLEDLAVRVLARPQR